MPGAPTPIGVIRAPLGLRRGAIGRGVDSGSGRRYIWAVKRTPLLVALVLVGVPLTVLLTARRAAPAAHLPSPALVVRHLRGQLRRDGATDIRCSWTRLTGRSFRAMCTGDGAGGAASGSLYELTTVVTTTR